MFRVWGSVSGFRVLDELFDSGLAAHRIPEP